MKILKNDQKTIFGVKYKLFTIIFNSDANKYFYYLNALGTNNVGDCMIFRSKKKLKIFNKSSLFILGFIYTIYSYLIKLPLLFILYPFWMYFDGCKNFILDGVWQTNVRFFNWVNIILLFILALVIIF